MSADPITYGGVPLAFADGAALDTAAAALTLWDLPDVRQGWRPPGLMPKGLAPGSLFWPWGASRCAVGHFLATDNELAKIRPLAYGTSGTAGTAWNALPLTMLDGRRGRSITTALFMLPPRPLDQIPRVNGLYSVLLVDDRYRWRERAADIPVTPGTTTWAALIKSIAAAIGITIATDVISAAYLSPSADLAGHFVDLPALLDRVLFSCGQRLVRSLAGAVTTQAPRTAKKSQDNQLAAFTKEKGGLYAFAPTKPTDLESLVPATALVTFPDVSNQTVPSGTPFAETVTLTSLALPEYAGIPGHTGTHTIRSAAAYDGTNGAQLLTLAKQAATDYYLWRLARQWTRFAGIDPYTPESLNDHVEWLSRGGECSTWVRRGDFEVNATLSGFGSAGSAIKLPDVGGGGSTSTGGGGWPGGSSSTGGGSPPGQGQPGDWWLVVGAAGQVSLGLGLGLIVYGSGDFQSGIKTSPTPTLPAPTLVNPPTGSTPYTFVTYPLVQDKPGPPSRILYDPIGPNTPPTSLNPIVLLQPVVPGTTAVDVYQLTPTPPGLVLTQPVTPGSPTVLLPVTGPPDPTKPPPTTYDPTPTVTTPNVTTTKILVEPLSTPAAPATVTPTTPGGNTISVKLVFVIDGTTTDASPVKTITNAGTIDANNPLNITVAVPPTFDPVWIPNTYVLVYITTPNTTAYGPGPVLVDPIPPGTKPGDSFVVPYLGNPPLPYLPATPPATNLTGTATIPVIVGSLDMEPLRTPQAPTVTPQTTGGTTVSYAISANDALGNHSAVSPATTITNSNAVLNNVISWLAVGGAASYGVWRTAGGATQGLLATVTPDSSGRLVYTDANATADGTTAPTAGNTGDLTTAPSTAAGAGLNVPPGTAPTSPESGDVWNDGTNLLASVGGVTTNLTSPAGSPVWTKVATEAFGAFSDVGNTHTVTAYTLPARAWIHAVVLKHSAAFTGGTVATCTAKLTIGGNDFITGFDVHGAPGGTLFAFANDANPGAGYIGKVYSFTGTTAVTCTLTSTGDTLNHLTAGSLDVWALVSTLP